MDGEESKRLEKLKRLKAQFGEQNVFDLKSRPATPATITVPEIVARLQIARGAVYELLERKEIPAIRLGQNRRWIISRRAYEEWEASFGTGAPQPERRPPSSETKPGVEASVRTKAKNEK